MRLTIAVLGYELLDIDLSASGAEVEPDDGDMSLGGGPTCTAIGAEPQWLGFSIPSMEYDGDA